MTSEVYYLCMPISVTARENKYCTQVLLVLSDNDNWPVKQATVSSCVALMPPQMLAETDNRVFYNNHESVESPEKVWSKGTRPIFLNLEKFRENAIYTKKQLQVYLALVTVLDKDVFMLTRRNLNPRWKPARSRA